MTPRMAGYNDFFTVEQSSCLFLTEVRQKCLPLIHYG
jgi:hypothetical protein